MRDNAERDEKCQQQKISGKMKKKEIKKVVLFREIDEGGAERGGSR